VIRIANDAHFILALGAEVKTCIDVGLDVSDHLKQMNMGTVDFGTPADKLHAHYLKDFEFELMILARLVTAGTLPTLFPYANDPRGDAICGNLYLECKHPNSVKQLKKLIAAFGKSLETENKFGVFAVALEDCFNLGDAVSFPTVAHYRDWLENKRNEMEVLGRRLAAYAARFEHIVGIIFTQTKLLVVEQNTRLERLGNAILFDGHIRAEISESEVLGILTPFNPAPLLLSSFPSDPLLEEAEGKEQ
jgi:translation initiation factor 6 (eIF-6)